MFFPFMNVGSQTFQIRNAASQTFTAPYRCLVVFSDIKFDDENNGSIILLDMEEIQSGGLNRMFLFGVDGATASTIIPVVVGSYIVNSGQRILMDAVDDFDVTINYFRLPDNP